MGWPLVSSTVAESAPPLPPPPPPLPLIVGSKRTYSCRLGLVGLGLGREGEPHQDRVPARVGDVGGLDAVQAVLVRRGHLAGHPAGVGHGLHRVRHVAGLEVGEGRAVRDDVLKGFDVGVVDGRVVDVAQDPARDRVPDLRRRVPGRAQAVLAGQVEVRQRTRAAGRAVVDGNVDREDVRRCVVGEGDLRAVGRDGERDVRSVEDAAGAVVLVPALVDGDLARVRVGRQGGCLEGVDAVAVDVLQPGPEAARIPVAGTTQLGLEGAGDRGDRRALVVGDPVALVVVVELDARNAWQVERDVGAVVLDGVEPVVLVPGVVERRLVFVITGGQVVERPLPDVVVVVVGQVGRRARWIPFPWATCLVLKGAGNGHRRRIRRVGRQGATHRQHRSHHDSGDQHRAKPVHPNRRGRHRRSSLIPSRSGSASIRLAYRLGHARRQFQFTGCRFARGVRNATPVGPATSGYRRHLRPRRGVTGPPARSCARSPGTWWPTGGRRSGASLPWSHTRPCCTSAGCRSSFRPRTSTGNRRRP